MVILVLQVVLFLQMIWLKQWNDMKVPLLVMACLFPKIDLTCSVWEHMLSPAISVQNIYMWLEYNLGQQFYNNLIRLIRKSTLDIGFLSSNVIQQSNPMPSAFNMVSHPSNITRVIRSINSYLATWSSNPAMSPLPTCAGLLYTWVGYLPICMWAISWVPAPLIEVEKENIL